ncbi:hypothetical protein H312_00672 [Anncaliia algerae PRA339]|uniref:DNA-directed RNA polymerases I, II, and III subunit RPABC1 n=1 Tax=Anncaliia algerae PRA339 TaxID=1288291 RepID=A0A059F4L5_9MICR|nr:hypothetical protein H312_00672 [Anncaliia algerae PRA339]
MVEKAQSFYLKRKTVLEILHERGYFVPESELEQTYSDFLNAFVSTNQLEQIYKSNNKAIFVVFNEEQKLSVKAARMILENAKSYNINNVLIVVQEGHSHQVNDLIKDYKEIKVEIFKEKEVLFNVIKHELVPKHRIMSDEEKAHFLEKNRVMVEQLPQIMIDDIVARYYGAKRGDLFEIIRKGENGEVSYYYRITQ